ncbi:hypothetical protein V6Z12_D08G141000 [Gossypium hirsutum]
MVMFSATWPATVHRLAQEYMDPNLVKELIYLKNGLGWAGLGLKNFFLGRAWTKFEAHISDQVGPGLMKRAENFFGPDP